jgi:hypothetical protein
MLVESIILAGAVGGSTALILDETNTNIYRHVTTAKVATKKAIDSYIDDVLRECFRNNKYVQLYRKNKADLEKERADEAKKTLVTAFQEEITLALKYIDTPHYINCYGTTDVTVYSYHPADLFTIRKLLKKICGNWNDKIDRHYCSNDKLTVYYKGSRHYQDFNITIDIVYDLDSLPDGILKDGCKVIKETTTHETCRIECAI